MRQRDPISHYIPSLRRRLEFLKQREHKNSFDLAEIGALEWALVNLPTHSHARLAQPQRTHWEGCEEMHPECRLQAATSAESILRERNA